MKTLRTPEACFTDLPGYPFQAHYVSDLPGYESLRIHFLDEGPKDAGNTFLCLHGQPTWSYLYRHMIPVFTSSGARVICPDWLGFGRSDKPENDAIYSFEFHRTMMIELVERLDLQNCTLVVQDWGGLLGLTLPMEIPERFSRLLIMNTALAIGQAPGEGFLAWRDYAEKRPDLDVASLMKRAVPHLSDAEASAYGAPFPDIRYKAGVRRFPKMVMTSPDMPGVVESRRAMNFWKSEWNGRSFMAVGANDPVLGLDVMMPLQRLIRGCPPPLVLEHAGHFTQEWGVPIAEAALKAFSS